MLVKCDVADWTGVASYIICIGEPSGGGADNAGGNDC